jgi:hypothetical protein
VLVPVVPLDLVVQQTAAIEQSIGLLRSRDAITPYMYSGVTSFQVTG